MKQKLLIVNGWGFNKGIFDALANDLEEGFEIEFIDSTEVVNQSTDYNFKTNRPLVMTWSLGFNYYIRYVHKYLDPVGLIVVSAGAKFIADETYPWGWHQRIVDRMVLKLKEEAEQVMLDFISRATLNKVQVDKALLVMPDLLPRSLSKLSEIDIRKDLQTIKCKTMIVHGVDDKIMCLDHAIWLKEHIPHSQLMKLDKCGHIPQLEKRGELVKLINTII